jgi:release factor glutamine methyltransferase
MDAVLDDHEKFAVIVADPPWVRTSDVGRYPEDPVSAIDGGGDGLALARTCLDVIDRHLRVEGSAVLQVGPLGQAERIGALVASYDELDVVAVRDHERGALVRIDRVPTEAA